MLFYGVVGIVGLAREWNQTDGEDVFAVAMFNMIGAISMVFAFRWIRSAIRPWTAVMQAIAVSRTAIA
jgi:hypothetical protein